MNQWNIGEAVDLVHAGETHRVARLREFVRVEPVSINPAKATEARRASNG